MPKVTSTQFDSYVVPWQSSTLIILFSEIFKFPKKKKKKKKIKEKNL
jgi:hypothetical protein